MASAEYYLESQRSFWHPNEYYTAGEEPDGTWFNPKGLFGLGDGVKVDSGQFQRLYNGFEPDGSRKLVQRAGNPDRSPGVDMTFSRGQERVFALGDRRSVDAGTDRGDGGRSRPGGAGRHGVRVLQLYPCRREGCHPPGRSGPVGCHLRTRHQPRERSAASRALHHLQPCEDARRRQVAGPPPIPGLQLEEGGRRPVPGVHGLGPATGPRRAHGAVRPKRRVHPHRGDAGGPAIFLVQAAQGDRRAGRRARHPNSRERVADGRSEQAHARRQVARQRPGGSP